MMVHLTRLHFTQMLVLAFLLHLTGLIIWSAMPRDQLLSISVRALNIKLGGADEELLQRQTMPEDAPPVIPDTNTLMGMLTPEAGKENITPEERNMDSVISSLEAAIGKNDFDLVEKKDNKKKKQDTLVRRSTLANAVPAEYVRRSQGNPLGNSNDANAESVIARYEQLVALWIKRHKVYPVEARRMGIEGEAVISVQLNRSGRIVYYNIIRPTGNAILDRALVDMIRAANPVPAMPPAYYPGEQLNEFQMTITFNLEGY